MVSGLLKTCSTSHPPRRFKLPKDVGKSSDGQEHTFQGCQAAERGQHHQVEADQPARHALLFDFILSLRFDKQRNTV